MAETRDELACPESVEGVESNCPFCDINQFKERLIAEIDGFFIIASLGQITNGGYVLLFPKKHVPCMGTLRREKASRMLSLANKVCRVLTREYGLKQSRESLYPVTLFEHGIVGQTVKHAHLHFLPTILDLTPRILSDFPESQIEQIEYVGHLQNLYRKKPQPYLNWMIGQEGNTKVRICWDPPAPPQYLRIIAAEALGRPERANWRTMDSKLDKRLWSETVRRLKPYFV